MKKILAKYPYLVSGLILGLAALGNLIRNYGEVYRTVLGIIAMVLLAGLIVKIITDFKGFTTFLENPIAAAAFTTAPMSITILSTYFLPAVPPLARMIWFTGIALNLLMMVWFTVKFAFRFKIGEVFTTWSILYVGIVTASVTAPAYKMLNVGQGLFWLGFVGYFAVMPAICRRVFKVKNIPEPILPALVVFCAPISLLLAGYMSSFPKKNMFILGLIAGLSMISYIYSLAVLPKLLKLKFYPTISAFTFPLVISAIGWKMLTAFIGKQGGNVQLLSIMVKCQEVIAVAIVAYVLISYMKFTFANES